MITCLIQPVHAAAVRAHGLLQVPGGRQAAGDLDEHSHAHDEPHTDRSTRYQADVGALNYILS